MGIIREHPLLRSAMRGRSILKSGKRDLLTTATEEAGLYSRTTTIDRQTNKQTNKQTEEKDRTHIESLRYDPVTDDTA
jgi:hypothetical protein